MGLRPQHKRLLPAILLTVYVFATSANALCCFACGCKDGTTDRGSCCCSCSTDDEQISTLSIALSGNCCCSVNQSNKAIQTATSKGLKDDAPHYTSSISLDKNCNCIVRQDNKSTQTIAADNAYITKLLKLSWAESCRHDTYLPLTISARNSYLSGNSNPCPTMLPLLSRCVAPRAPAGIA